MRAAETAMRPHGLTSVQWAPLMIISRGGNPTAASLARDLNTDTGAMTRMLDRLEAKGLLQRTRSSTDRRVVELTLTDQGRELTHADSASSRQRLQQSPRRLHAGGIRHAEADAAADHRQPRSQPA